MRDAIDKIMALLRSWRFFVFILAFFIFESVWVAFSALYPQAFDENFHFGLIKIYSHYWLPFLSHQPPGANTYGAVPRDPSYLYHYVMSFPYRFFALFTHSQSALVILFRLIDVGLFGAGLVLFRKVLLRMGVSRSLANFSLLLFVLIPIVPQLAAQVNYDDLLFLLVAWVCLQTFNITDQLRKRQPSAQSILILVATCLFTSLVKYAFLPIFFAVVVFLVAVGLRSYKNKVLEFWADFVDSFKKLSLRARIILPAIVLLSIGMFIQRDGVNFVKYHSAVPDCATVLSVQDCRAYSPWYYNYTNHQQVLAGSESASYGLRVYTGQWFYWMWYRLFFAVNGADSNFANYPPLPLPSIAAALVALIGLVAIIRWRRRLFHNNPYIIFVLGTCLIYAAALFIKGYATYKYTAVLENMNGRYLLPILPLVAAVAGKALSYSLRRWQTQKVIIAILVLFLFLQGGGILTFIDRSDDSWYWPSPAVKKVNRAARKITKPVIIKNKKTTVSNAAPGLMD